MPLALLTLALLGTPPSGVAPPTIAYDAPAGCPAQREFLDTVVAHGGDLSAADAADAERVLVVSIRHAGDAFVGSFHVRRPAGVTDSRELRATSCSELADALAMVTAIALHSAPEQPPVATPVSPEIEPVVPHQAIASPEAADSERLRATTEIFPRRVETLRVEAGELRFDLARTTTLNFGGTWGLVPSTLLPRYELTQTIAHFLTTPGAGQRIVGLVYQLNVDFLGTAQYRSPNTNTDIYGLAFGFSVCQSPHYDSRGLTVLFCGGYGGGFLHLGTSALDGTSVQTKSAGFGNMNATVDIQYNLSASLLLSARVGGSLTIGDVSAERSDGTRIFKSSPWSGSAMLGIGFRF